MINELWVLVDVTRLNGLRLMGVQVHPQQSELVGGNPDVATLVAHHAVDVTVHAKTRQSETFADAGVPGSGTLVIHAEGALSVEPDIILLVGKGLERLGTALFQLRQSVGDPDGVLLVHHVAAGQFTVVIHDDGTVATLADRGDHTLWHALLVVGIAELEEQLLLLVVADDALVGNGAPEVLMLVDEDHRGDGLDTHACKGLLHIALEGLRLGVVDTIARRCLDEQVAVEHLLDGVDVAVVERRTVLRVTLEVTEGVAVVAVEAGRGAEPHITA